MAEAMIDKIAVLLAATPSVRKRNLYGPTTGSFTPYGMKVEHNLLPDMIAELEETAQYGSAVKLLQRLTAKAR